MRRLGIKVSLSDRRLEFSRLSIGRLPWLASACTMRSLELKGAGQFLKYPSNQNIRFAGGGVTGLTGDQEGPGGEMP